MGTPFSAIYDAFFTIVTDDMYLAITKEQTAKDCQGLLLASIPLFEFPKKILKFTLSDESIFNNDLDLEEINILRTGMSLIWLQRQITSIESTRQKFSGPDFRMSSQASHLQRLMLLQQNTLIEHRRLQMLYSRRRVVNDEYESTFDLLVKKR